MTVAYLRGPSYAALQKEAFDRAAEQSGSEPSSVIWLDGNSHRQSYVADAWAANHPPLEIQVTSFSDIVGECYDHIAGPARLLDAPTRRRIIDHTLRSLAADDVLPQAHRYRGEFSALFNTLESNRYADPASVERLAAESLLSDRAETVLTEAYARFNSYRDAVTTPDEYTQHEAYETVLTADTEFTDSFPTADVVVVAGYYELSRNQQRFLSQIADEISLIVTLPLVGSAVTADRASTGANTIVADTDAFYRQLSSTVETVASTTSLQALAGNLYTPGNSSVEGGPDELTWTKPTTPDREIRHVARTVRDQLATEDVHPDDILIVVPGLLTYRESIEEIFDQYDLPVAAGTTRLLYQTYTGRAILDAVGLCEEDDPSVETVAALLTNPLTNIPGDDHAAIAGFARRLLADNIDALVEQADFDTSTALKTLFEQADAAARSSGVEVIAALRELFDTLGIKTQLEQVSSTDGELSFDARMERRAYRQVQDLLGATARVTEELGPHETLVAMSDALDKLQVSAPRQASHGVIEVVGIEDSYMQSFDHLYFMDLVERDFPVDPDQPRFFEHIEENFADIEPTAHRSEARYQFATLLASADTVHLTTPEMTTDDSSLLESAVLDELRRVTGIEPSGPDHRIGSPEDVQRALGRIRGQPPDEAASQAIDNGVFEPPAATFIQRGVTCAMHRSSPQVRTRHDGQLDTAVVDDLHPAAEREGYSPTRLTRYAKCGFKYYADRVIDLETPDEISLEPDPLEVGSIIHDTLEMFYTELQDEPGDSVDLSDWDRDTLEERLLTATHRVLDTQELHYEDAFYESWLDTLLAGLCDAARNDHFGGDGIFHSEAAGVFSRFLDHELEQENTPAWFEVGMDFAADGDGEFELVLPSGRSVAIGGRIDRVMIDMGSSPPTATVHDYKTSSQTTKLTIDGVDFQLPLYAIAASREFEDSDINTPVDAGYYIVDPPDGVREPWSLTTYIGRMSGSDSPQTDYERLLETATPQRLEAIIDGIEGGAYQPTIVDADTAGCRYCDYRNVCDVRHHHASGLVTTMDTDDRPGYVPQAAREDSLLDQYGGDDA